jgi:hypothetical protein
LEDRSLVVTDVRIFEKEDVGHLPFGLRMNLLMKSLLPRSPPQLRIRPFFQIRHAQALLKKKGFQFPVSGFAIRAVNATFDYGDPTAFVWAFSPPNPIVVVFVDFEANSVTGTILGTTALVAVAAIEGVRGSPYLINGKLAEIEIIGGPENGQTKLMKAKFVRPVAAPQPWSTEQLERVYPELRPTMTLGELSGFF